MLNKIFFLFYSLTRPNLLSLLANRLYLPVYFQYEWIKAYDIKTVIDVGGNKGHVTKALSYIFPQAMIHVFEPIPEEFNALTKKFSSKKILVNQLAVSDNIEEVEFFVNDHTPSSSLLEVTNEMKKNIPAIKRSKKIKVKTTTLNSHFKSKKLNDLTFLKIDVHGAEDLVLKGADKILKKIALIHIETSFKKIYTNQVLFDDIYKFLLDNKFRYLGNANDSDYYPRFGLPLQENSIFINTAIEKRLKK